MHSLEAACNEAQNIIDQIELFGTRTESCGSRTSQASFTPVPGPSWSNTSYSQSLSEPSKKSRIFNIRQRLRELYLEECRNTQPCSSTPLPLNNLKRGSRLLEKLVQKDNLNTLIVNLYPGNKGYSLSLRLQGKVPAALGNQAGRSQGSEPVIETMRWPYSDEELLRCIDNEEIPATLVDLLETNHSELFYQGCVIAEIRDYRLTFPLFNFETHYVLLKPTTQSIINDVNIISSSQDFTAEDRLSLESQIVLATAPPLCLDPNPVVGILINNLTHRKQRLSTTPLRRTARKFSQVTVNRKRKLDQFTSHNNLQLYDFITRKKAKIKAANQGKHMKKTTEGALPLPPPVPSEELPPLQLPSVKPDVFKYAKQYEKSRETSDCSVHLIEEYILETERGQGRIYRIKLTILQRHSNMEYLGELYVDRDYKEGERSGASCRFVLGTRLHANRYVQQFTEIFTEEGRKSVRITHVIPGQQHHVSYTPGMRERNAQAKKSAQPPQFTALGKQPAIVNNMQNSALNHNPNLQHILPSPQQLSTQGPHADVSSGSVINLNLNSQQIQKLHGQLNTTNASLLPQNSNTNSNIQINPVSHLTSLLANTNVTAPPNVNVHQIQHTPNVIGITGQSLANLSQPVQSISQNVVNVQNIGITTQNVSNSNIQNLLNNSLSTNVLSDDSLSNLTNGSASSGVNISQTTAVTSTSNATIHHPPTQSQTSASKSSRPGMATNPAISALVTSLMNSAQQFQVQQAAQQAASSNPTSTTVQPSGNNLAQSATSNTTQNPTILSLLNATTPLNINNNNSSTISNNGSVITTSPVNPNQQNQKLLTRKTITSILNSRLINQNISGMLNSSGNVGNPTLVVNNANSQQLRVTLSSLNQLMNASTQNSSQNQAPQIVNIGNVSQLSSSNPTTGFTIATTQGNITIATQTTNLTSQTFTIANANSQTFTITSPNTLPNQNYSINASALGNLSQTSNQTFTFKPSTSASPQSFTISPTNTSNMTNSNNLSNAGFTLSPTQNSCSQPQTYTVLQPNQTLSNQSFAIATPLGNQGFTVSSAQPGVGNQGFTLTSSNLSAAQSKSFQVNNHTTNNQAFAITTPVVTVPNQFVNCQSSASSQSFSPQSSPQTLTINASSQQTNTTSVFTVNSSLPNQVFTVNIPSPKQGFNQNFSNSSQSNNKSYSSQNSVLINKNQTFNINTHNQNFAVTTPVLTKNIDCVTNSSGENNSNGINIGGSSGGENNNGCSSGASSVINNLKISKDNNCSNNSIGGNFISSNSNISNNINSNSNNNSSSSTSKNKNNNNNSNSNNSNNGSSRVNNGRIAACQMRLSSALQNVSQNSELNKLLLDRTDTRLLTDTNKLHNDKNDSENSKISQSLTDNKKLISENNKLSQALSSHADSGSNTNVNAIGHSQSNLGLSMPGLSALLAGTPSADNPIPGASNSNSLLERLTSSAPNATAFNSPPPPLTPQSPNVASLSPNQNLNFQSNAFSTSPANNTFNSINSNSPLPNITSPVPNITSPSPKNQVHFQNSSPNSKEMLGIASPVSSPPGSAPVSLNLQGLSLQGITGLQNVQVSIPGLPVPISLSLNVAGQPGGTQGVLMTSLPVAPTTNTATTTSVSPIVLTNTGSAGSGGSVLSLPVAQLMASGVKSANQKSSNPNSISLAQGTPQSIQLVSSLHKSVGKLSGNQNQGRKNLQPIPDKGTINTPKNTFKSSRNSGNMTNTGHGNQILTFAAQQQLQLALQKQAQMQQCYPQNQKRPLSPSSIATKHRRRSNATDSNK